MTTITLTQSILLSSSIQAFPKASVLVRKNRREMPIANAVDVDDETGSIE